MKAKNTSETVGDSSIAAVKMTTITHHERTRCDSSV